MFVENRVLTKDEEGKIIKIFPDIIQIEELSMKKSTVWLAGLLALITLTVSFQLVLAHEEITVGDYTLEIGWLGEPPVIGQQNAIVVNATTTTDQQPVEDVSGLMVTVSYGGQEKALTLQPLGEDTPGQFIALLIPTIPGQYTIKLGGTLGGTAVDAEVEPEEVGSSDTLEFPNVADSTESTITGVTNWLIYLSLLIGVIALVLGGLALRKQR